MSQTRLPSSQIFATLNHQSGNKPNIINKTRNHICALGSSEDEIERFLAFGFKDVTEQGLAKCPAQSMEN